MSQPAICEGIQQGAFRAHIRLRVENVPGQPGARANNIANAFLETYFSRKFDWTRDYMYAPCKIDSERGSVDLLLDINTDQPPPDKLLSFKLKNSDGIIQFEPIFVKDAQHFSQDFQWGGRKAP